MSAIQTPASVVLADLDRPTDDTIAGALIEGDPVAVEQLIAGVLGQAHRTAERFDAPDEARTILHVAHSFADELAVANPDFDRLRFIETVTGDLS